MAEITDLNGNKIPITPEQPKEVLEDCFFCEEQSEPYQLKETVEHNGKAVIVVVDFYAHICERCQWQALNMILEGKNK